MKQTEPDDRPSNVASSSAPLGTRHKRYSDFKSFLESANDRFTRYCQGDKDARRFDAIYHLCIAPGGRMGGIDKRQLEVFFGQRQYDVQEKYGDNLRRSQRLLTERGATLEYVQDDLGRVHCCLYPAASEGMKPLEDFIQLPMIDDPKRLSSDRDVRRHFRYLVAYMQCTSLDGEPRLAERLLVGWLRVTRTCGIDGRMQMPRIKSAFHEIVKFGLTVGLSGFLLAFVVWAYSRGETQNVFVTGESSELTQERALINQKLDQQSDLLNKIQSTVVDMKDRLDKPIVVVPNSKRIP